MRTVLLSLFTSLALTLAGCPGSAPPPAEGGTPSTAPEQDKSEGAKAPAAKPLPAPKPLPKPGALPTPNPVPSQGAAAPASGKGGPETNTAPPGPEILGGPDLENMAYRVTVEAKFSGLPAGAHIVAPSARDRRYQKVTKSEHGGIPGAVTATEDGENLFFVSEATQAGEASYVGTFEVNRRVGTEGGVERAKDKAFAAGKGSVKAGPKDSAMKERAAALGPEGMKPLAVLIAALTKSGSTSGQSAYDHANTAATLMRLRGVPATVIGGYLAPKEGNEASATHSWVLAELPAIGLTPMDPVLSAQAAKAKGAKEGAEPPNMGLIDAERIEMVSGDALVIAEQKGTNPRLELNGDVVAPQAIKEGKSVGEVTWKVRFEKLPAKKK